MTLMTSPQWTVRNAAPQGWRGRCHPKLDRLAPLEYAAAEDDDGRVRVLVAEVLEQKARRLDPRVITWCRWVVVKERTEGCGSGREGALAATSGEEQEAGGYVRAAGAGGEGPGRLGAERAAAVSEDGLHREGILHGGDDLQPAATDLSVDRGRGADLPGRTRTQ